ncbi:MAG TPA: hypothetical protein VK610_04585, partial [Rhodothermales bacterium]|nr:hypothetical protein [Rhodothermales bacterium]
PTAVPKMKENILVKLIKSKDHFMIRYLVAPLVFIFAVTITAAFVFDVSNGPRGIVTNLLINFATEAISIIATIMFVDKVLNNHDNRQKASVIQRMNQALRGFHNVTHASIRESLGLEYIFVPMLMDLPSQRARANEIQRLQEELGQKGMINHTNAKGIDDGANDEAVNLIRNFSRDFMIPRLPEFMDNMNNKEWYDFADRMKKLKLEIDNIMSKFGNYLSPDQHSALIDSNRHISGFEFQHYMIAGLIGNNPEDVFNDDEDAQMRDQLRSLQISISQNSAFHITNLLHSVSLFAL